MPACSCGVGILGLKGIWAEIAKCRVATNVIIEHFNLKTASATRLRRAALHEARNGVCHSIASCALQLGHSCGFQGTKWVARKDS